MSNYIFSESSKGKLWRTPPPYMLNKSKADFEAPAYKKTSEKDGYTKRFFFIKENFLFYKKKENISKASGFMSLNWTSVEFNHHDGDDAEMLYEITFVRNGKFSCIYLKTEEELGSWMKALGRICIRTDFNRKFDVVGYIDSGSYGKVILFSKFFFDFFEFFFKNEKTIFFY